MREKTQIVRKIEAVDPVDGMRVETGSMDDSSTSLTSLRLWIDEGRDCGQMEYGYPQDDRWNSQMVHANSIDFPTNIQQPRVAVQRPEFSTAS